MADDHKELIGTTEFSEILGDPKTEVEIVTIDRQRYRIRASRSLLSPNLYWAAIEELGVIPDGRYTYAVWLRSALPGANARDASSAIRIAAHQIRDRVRARLDRLGPLQSLSPFVCHDELGRLSWTRREDAVAVAKDSDLPHRIVEQLDLHWANINQRIDDGQTYLQPAGADGLTLREFRDFVGPVATPPQEQKKKFEWPAERPKGWPSDWPYPPPDDWMPPLPPPLPAGPPSLVAAPPAPPEPTSVSVGPFSWKANLRKGVTVEEHWYGNCYCVESDIVDELIDALNEAAAAAAGASVPSVFGKLPWLFILTGGYSATAWWWSAHLSRVRRESNCKAGQSKGVKICIYLAMFPSAEGYCYPPSC